MRDGSDGSNKERREKEIEIWECLVNLSGWDKKEGD